MGAIPHAHKKSIHVRLGHASRRRHHGRARAIGSAADSQRLERRAHLMAKPAVVIIGAGHNGLITAFYLAKAGYKPIVLERRETVGGAAITEEFHPGFKCSTLAHAMGPLAPELMRAMKLKRHGLEWIRAEPSVTALHPDGRCLPLYADTTRSAQAIAKFSEKDARRYPEFQRTLHQVAGVLARTLTMTPPEIDSPSTGDIFKLLGTGRAFRKLGKKGMFRLLRWGPMAAADLMAEWFETELLRAVIAARGIFGTAMGPWSAGSSAVLLLRAAADAHPVGSAAFPRGGLGAFTCALAESARQVGAEIRTDAEVQHLLVNDGAV